MKTFSALIFILLCIGNNFAQIDEDNYLPSIMPANPKAFEFMKYEEVPVSKYTGLPNISIPIYTIEAKGLNIPIGLSYHSNGFRVNEEAGWTGLGWTLNLEASIVQIINGFDDFGTSQLRNRTMPDIEQIFYHAAGPGTPNGALDLCERTQITLNQEDFEGLNSYGEGDGGCINEDAINFPHWLSYGTKDYEPDTFQFNALGHSCKFILDWENEVFVSLDNPQIKIESNYDGVSSGDGNSLHNTPSNFTITVPEGHKFIFELKENTTIVTPSISQSIFPTSPNSTSFQSVSSWISDNLTGEASSRVYKLTQIITNKGDIVNFNYQVTSSPIKNDPSLSEMYMRYKTVSMSGTPIPVNDSHITTIMETEQSFSYLESITFNNGMVKFSTSDRVDLVGSRKLDKIEIKSKINSGSYNTINAFNFSYSYFIGHNYGTQVNDNQTIYANWWNRTANEYTHRLKLSSITETGKNPYTFTYNSEQLPKKTSLATDYWGFYNGNLQNQSLFPNIYRFNYQGDVNDYLDEIDNNKSSSLEHTKAAVLERIDYPTGGYSSFEYELNTFNNYYAPNMDIDNGITIINIGTDNGQANTLPQQAEIFYFDNTILTGNLLLSTRGCNFGSMYSNTYIKVEYFDESITEQVENSQYGYLYALSGLSQYIVETDYISMNYNDPEELLVNDFTYTLLRKGPVRFTAVGGCGTYNGTVNSSGAWMNVKGITGVNINSEYVSYGAGLRIKSILTNPNTSLNDNTSIKYTTFNYEGGKLMSPLIYHNKYLVSIDAPSSIGPFVSVSYAGFKLKFTSSNNIQPSTAASGKYVGYDTVTENFNSYDLSKSNGKIKSIFTNQPPSGAAIPNPNTPGQSLDISTDLNIPLEERNLDNGLLQEEYIYDKNENLVKTTINTYDHEYLPICFNGLKILHKDIQLCAIVNDDYSENSSKIFNDTYLLGIYPIKGRFNYLKKSVERLYSGNNFLETVVENQHDSYNQKYHSNTTRSNGDTLEITYKYPYDFTGQYPFDNMVNDNQISTIVETETLQNNQPIELQKFDFKKWQVGYYWSYPKTKFYMAKGVNPPKEIITFQTYDSNHNLIEVSLKDGSHIYYIWGYHGNYPIAKIENFTSSQATAITSLISAAKNASDNDNGANNQTFEDSLRTALAAIRNHSSLQTSLVTTYTYDPLIGVTSITDPKGVTIYYHYDQNNRLEYVIDQDGHLLSKNEYNYNH